MDQLACGSETLAYVILGCPIGRRGVSLFHNGVLQNGKLAFPIRIGLAGTPQEFDESGNAPVVGLLPLDLERGFRLLLVKVGSAPIAFR